VVSRSVLEEVLADSVELRPPDLVRREVSLPLKMSVNRAIAVVGPRRAGKTYLLFQAISDLSKENPRESVLYVNLEDYRLSESTWKDLIELYLLHLELYPTISSRWVLLDEVQSVEGWERAVRNLLDRGARVVVTGSSSKLLSLEVATHLRGRSITVELLPFSFREFLAARGFEMRREPVSSLMKSKILSLVREYMEWGGYPEAVLEPKQKEKILREIWEVTVARDIVERWRIRNIRALRVLLNAIRSSTKLSVHALYRYFKSMGIKISKNTVYQYLEYLKDAMIVFTLPKYSPTYKTVLGSVPKIYLVDNGLYLGKAGRGRLLESLVFLELRRRGYREGENLFYWEDSKGEVDFILTDRAGRIERCLQVTWELVPGDSEQRKRELGSLARAKEKLACKEVSVFTWDQEGDEKGFEIIPFWKWVMGLRSEVQPSSGFYTS